MKKLTVTVALIILLLQTACVEEPKLPTLPTNFSIGDAITMGVNTSVSLGDENLHISFLKVKDESRCPETWECMWVGEAVVRLKVCKGELTEYVDLIFKGGECANCGNEIPVFDYRIKLLSLSPYPDAAFYEQKPLNFETYQITIEVRKGNDLFL